MCALYTVHGINQRKGPESFVKRVWHGLRSFSSKKSLLMTHLRKLVIVAGRCRVATVKRLSRLSLNKDILAFISVLGRQGKKAGITE